MVHAVKRRPIKMLSLDIVYSIIGKLIPLESMQLKFMQQAMLGLLLLAPMTASMGVQVVNFRMAFFADAISHSAFAGVALGILLSISPHLSMPIFGVLVGIGIMLTKRRSTLSSDTIIGVFFSAAIAFGLAVVSRNQDIARNMQQFLYGDILTISEFDLWTMILLFIVLLGFQIIGYNKMLYIGMNQTLAKAHKIQVGIYQYTFAVLLALVVIFSVWAVGVLLVTALLIVPAAASRNFSKSAGAMLWWSILISLSSSIAGLIISAQDWANTATGATIILVAFAWFLVSLVYNLATDGKSSHK